MNSRRVPPEPDELEVSVFGLRKGESIAVHVPDGPWFVIDSMTSGTGTSRAPVAATYLRDYLDVNELYGVFLTHWHDDHTRGAADLMLQFASSLKVVGLPIALSTRELMAFVSDLLPDAQRAALQRDVLEIMTKMKKPELKDVHVVSLHDGTHLEPSGVTWSLEALSPSIEDERAQAATIAKFLPDYQGEPAKSFDVNSGCAVLRLEVDGMVVIFASDLDVGDSPQRGWQSIHRVHGARLASRIVKIGHHGSQTALHPPSWMAHATDVKPYGVMTPFPAVNEYLPRDREISEFKRHCERVHLAGVRKARDKEAGKVAVKNTPFTGYLKTDPPSAFERVAQVRYRIRKADAHPRVEVFPPAQQL